jgi:hypothetical protein
MMRFVRDSPLHVEPKEGLALFWTASVARGRRSSHAEIAIADVTRITFAAASGCY